MVCSAQNYVVVLNVCEINVTESINQSITSLFVKHTIFESDSEALNMNMYLLRKFKNHSVVVLCLIVHQHQIDFEEPSNP